MLDKVSKISYLIIIKNMNILSLFDGISCGQVALKRAGIKIDNYYASEIDENAIKVTQHNYPDTIQLGNIVNINVNNLPKIDLLMGGSPCQSFSFIGKRKGMITKNEIEISNLAQYIELKNKNFEFEGQSYLFWEYVKILQELKPKYFLLENVKMSKKWEKIISECLKVKPIKINSALVSAQNRNRLYWTNIPNIDQPLDKHIKASSIKELNNEFNYPSTLAFKNGVKISKFCKNGKMPTLTTVCGSPNGLGRPFWASEEFTVEKPFNYSKVKKITPLEAERLQTLPDNYTSILSDNARYKVIGNGWTVDVLCHIFKNLC